MEKMKEFDQAGYYQLRKTEISRRRKAKYRMDKAHRDKLKTEARDWWRKNRAVSTPVDRTVVRSDGIDFFSVSFVARVLGKKPSTIRDYHSKGIIPEASYIDGRGWRLYSESQIRLLREVFGKLQRKELSNRQEVSQELHRRWDSG